jgi:hypothetical protein
MRRSLLCRCHLWSSTKCPLSLSLSLSRIFKIAASGLAACLSLSALANEFPGKPPPGYPEYTPLAKQERVVDKDGLVPFVRAEKPFVDERGRTKVIVDFMDSAKDRFLEAARPAIAKFDPKRDRHNPQSLLLIDEKSKRYGIGSVYRQNERGEQERADITTWVGASLVAYLDAEQVNALRKDVDVRLLTEDRAATFSTQPPWIPDWNPTGAEWTELTDWGWTAVQGKSVLPGSNRIVWIVDSGVAYHTELTSVASRTSVDGQQVVGCYAHATHVAGIVGAQSGNGQGRRGIYAGVQMRSIGVGSAYGCTSISSPPTESSIAAALDYIYSQSVIYLPSASPKPNVVNISINIIGEGWSSSGVAQTNQIKMMQAAVPSYPLPGIWDFYNPGNVVVQSGGNQNTDACSYAYRPSANGGAHNEDGIIVVGALNSAGNRAAPFTAAYPSVLGNDPGSNYGPCIDLWAPGNLIYSTWGQGGFGTQSNVTYSESQPAECLSLTCTSPPHSGWAHGSGTSMAAPHVAAAAAYYIDLLNLSTPFQVESVLRANASLLPSGLKMVWLQ